MIPKEFETISEYVCKQTRWTDGSIRHDRMEDVVRCKDCIVFGTHGKNTDICPMWHNTHIDPYRDFCSRGVRKTDNNSEKPNNCEHITEDGVTCAKYPACDDCLDNPLNKVKGSERLVKGKTEPTISKMEQVEDEPKTQMKTQNSNLTFEKRTMRDCYNCKRYETEGECIECHYEPKDECAKEYEELGLKELKELIEADRKTENSSEIPNNLERSSE